MMSDFSEIGDEHSLGERSLVRRRAQHRGGMNRREHGRRPLGLDRASARFHDAERATEERLRGGGAEADDDLRFDKRDLVLEPREARAHFAGARRLVQSSRTARVARPFEVLDGIRHVDVVAVDTGCVQRAVEQLARRADERMAGFVFRVTGLFADEHHSSARRTFAENGLRPELEEIAAATTVGRRAKLRERRVRRNEVSGGAGWTRCFSRLRHAVRGLR